MVTVLLVAITVLLVATCTCPCLPLVILASTVNNYILFPISLNLNHTLTLVHHTTGGDVRLYTIKGRDLEDLGLAGEEGGGVVV